MDNLVEVATFTFPNEADVLESLLQGAGIEYFLKNGQSTQMLPALWTGGVILVVRASDASATVNLLKEHGFENYLNSEYL